MLIWLLVTCLVKFVAAQDVEWNSYCVTDNLGRPRISLENNSPRPIVMLLECSIPFSVQIHLEPHTIYTQRVYFPWEDSREDECFLASDSDTTFSARIEIYDILNDGSEYELWNFTYCSEQPGVETRTQVYTDCNCDHEGLVTYNLVNHLDESLFLDFFCHDIDWEFDYEYNTDEVRFEVTVPGNSHIEIEMVHHDWHNLDVSECVLLPEDGHYFFYYISETSDDDDYYFEAVNMCQQRRDREEPIAEVIPHCPASPAGSPEIELRAEIPSYAVAHCQNGPAHLSAVTQMSAIIDGSFDQDTVIDACQFYKHDDIDTYSLTVEVGWGLRNRELFLDSKIYTITCVYDDYGTSSSSVELVGQPYIAPEAINVYKSSRIPNGVFVLTILDVLDREVHVRNMASGSLMRLFASADTDVVGAFRAHTCSAHNGVTSYDILINGCGDGQIFDKREGFSTIDEIVVSPFFQVFKLRGGTNIWFDCVFTECDGSCDGTSCDFVNGPPAEVTDFDRFGEFGE